MQTVSLRSAKLCVCGAGGLVACWQSHSLRVTSLPYIPASGSLSPRRRTESRARRQVRGRFLAPPPPLRRGGWEAAITSGSCEHGLRPFAPSKNSFLPLRKRDGVPRSFERGGKKEKKKINAALYALVKSTVGSFACSAAAPALKKEGL